MTATEDDPTRALAKAFARAVFGKATEDDSTVTPEPEPEPELTDDQLTTRLIFNPKD